MRSLRRSSAPDTEDSRPAADGEADAPSWTTPSRMALASKVTRIAVWTLLAAGPVALLAAAATPTGHRPGAVRQQERRAETGPAGWAQLYVSAYLASDADVLRAFYPDAPTVAGGSRRRKATRTVATAAHEVRPGYWSVTVAADEEGVDGQGVAHALGVHYYSVAVLALGGPESGGTAIKGAPASYVATALPAEIAAPESGPAISLAYDNAAPISEGPLSDTVNQFLRAYLAGGGDLDRYLTPGKVVRPVNPVPYRQVQTTTIVPRGALPGRADQVPPDNTTTRVLATADAVDADGSHWPLTYALLLTARTGRWEVTAIEAAPELMGGGTQSPSPSAPGTPTAPAVSPTESPESSPPSSPGAASPSSPGDHSASPR